MSFNVNDKNVEGFFEHDIHEEKSNIWSIQFGVSSIYKKNKN